MAAAIWTVRRLVSNKTDIVDGIETVMINADDAGNEATTLAEAHAAVIAAGHAIAPVGYFDSADLSLTDMSTDEDILIMGARHEVIA